MRALTQSPLSALLSAISNVFIALPAPLLPAIHLTKR